MHARLPRLTSSGCGAAAASLLAVVVLAGCGEGSAAKTAAASSATAARSATTSPATAAGAAHRKAAAKAATAAPRAGATGATTGDGATPHGIKPEEQLGKTGFLEHSGLGFAAFHVYISAPLREHILSHPGAAQRAAVAKGAVAATYAARELTAAAAAAAAEQQVAQLATQLRTVSHRMQTIAAAMKAGTVDAAAIVAARKEVNEISLAALHLGQPIQEVTPKLP